MQIPGKMDSGGVSAVLMNYYRHIDKSEIKFDFAVNIDCSFPQEQELRAGGSKIYRVSSLKNIIGYCRDIYHVIRKEQYDIVHAHMNTLNVFPLMAAKMAGAEIRICHIHSTDSPEEKLRSAAKKILKRTATIFPTHYAACSRYAAEWMLGKEYVCRYPVQIIKNGINTERFLFDAGRRERCRREMGITDQYVIGCVGRFAAQKNHSFLIKVFEQVAERMENAVLILLGEGKLKQKIVDLVYEKHLDDKVIFLGVKDNIDYFYQGMDLFVLTSLYEGFPVVTTEAQAAGLPCVVSEAVPEEAVFTDRVQRLSLKQPLRVWRNTILQEAEKTGNDRKVKGCETLDIYENAKLLQKYYTDIAEESI